MFSTKSIFELSVLALTALVPSIMAQTTTSSASAIVTPTPTQPEMVDNCDAFYHVQTNDTCDAISSKFDLISTEFYSWNPSVGSGCPALILGDWVCVGTTGFAPSPTPSPIYSTTVDDCFAFYLVQSGDYCSKITQEVDITLSQFYEWNPSVGTSCEALILDWWVCVGA